MVIEKKLGKVPLEKKKEMEKGPSEMKISE